ncbi:site-specific DNA-methyltransferase [Candidatus Pacearchaeota archaeon]|nr:site-specific DNA-methyltransferase [Candidatus Pacearchaeota archaeon]
MVKKDYANWSKTELVKELDKLSKRKKYGIVWEDKSEQVAELCKEKLPILEEDKKKEIKTDDKKPIHILIEGDNYHALSVLNYTHKGAIDVIYIDPPYNTGNEGFVYNDNRVDLNDSYRHSKWLSFIEKRLKLSKNLLNSKGIIFISIDDNEVAQLKLLCDEIFGENNFIALIIVQTNKGGRDYLEIAKTHEYLLCYGKSNNIKLNEIPKDISVLKLEDETGKFEIRELRNRNPKFTKENRPNLYYPVYINPLLTDSYGHCAVSLIKSKSYSIEIFPKNSEGKDSCWRWGKKLVTQNIVENDAQKSQVVAKQKRDNGWNIYEKCRKSTTKAKSIWDDSEVRTERGTIALRNILGKALFDHPKPVELIDKILRLSTNENSIILDFFAGSGTTAQAVLELNNQDEGNRKFILCTNNESNNGEGYKILSDICYPRIEKVIKGYKDLKNQKIEGTGGHLKYFKTDFVDAEPTDKNKKKLVDKSTEMLCLKEDCFDEIKKAENYSLFKNSQDTYLGIIYSDDGIEPFKKEIKKIKKKFITYVFSLDESAREEEFEDVADLVELRPIPAVILNVYKRIFK